MRAEIIRKKMQKTVLKQGVQINMQHRYPNISKRSDTLWISRSVLPENLNMS